MLQALCDDHLLRPFADEEGAIRYDLFVSIQAFAEDKLASKGAVMGLGGVVCTGPAARDAILRRHAQWAASYGHPVNEARYDAAAGAREWSRERENLLIATRRAVDHQWWDEAVMAGMGVSMVMQLEGPLLAGAALADEVVAALPDSTPGRGRIAPHPAAT